MNLLLSLSFGSLVTLEKSFDCFNHSFLCLRQKYVHLILGTGPENLGATKPESFFPTLQKMVGVLNASKLQIQLW